MPNDIAIPIETTDAEGRRVLDVSNLPDHKWNDRSPHDAGT